MKNTTKKATKKATKKTRFLAPGLGVRLHWLTQPDQLMQPDQELYWANQQEAALIRAALGMS